ncbi:hypothetical protein ACVWY3_000487 [Bradyrhizobium sp. USDA 4486]
MNEHARADRLRKLGLGRILPPAVQDDYPLTCAHFTRLVAHVHFQPDLKPYVKKLLARLATNLLPERGGLIA